MPRKKRFKKQYLASFTDENWEMIERFKKDYPYTKDGEENSYNKIINYCVGKMLSMPKLKTKMVKDEQ